MTSNTLPVICQVLHSLNMGGAEVLAREFAVRSVKEFKTVFACLDSIGTIGHQMQNDGYCVEVLGRRSGFDYQLARRLASFCRVNRVSIIHAHQYAPFFYSALSRFPGWRPPILFTEHGRAFPDFRRPKRVAANRLLLRRHDKVIAVGQNVRQALIANEGIPPNRIEVVYNGIDLTAYSPSSAARSSIREELGLSENDFVVIQVARLNSLKDHGTAIRAMERLRASHSQIRLLLVGDGEEMPAIVEQIVKAGLRSTVHILGMQSDVARLLAAADLFLLTSVSEGIPLTVLEAMAMGLPCVATNVGGIPEIIVDGNTGLLANARDDSAIASHIARLAGDSRFRRHLGDRALARAHDLFSDRNMHRTYNHIYHEMVQSV